MAERFVGIVRRCVCSGSADGLLLSDYSTRMRLRFRYFFVLYDSGGGSGIKPRMQHGPLIVLSLGRSGSTFAQRLVNSVAGWYLFGEHNGAFRHFAEVKENLKLNAAAQKKYGDAIVQRANAFLEWSAWASPFDARDLNVIFAHNLRVLYTKKLPDNSLWGFKEIRYTATDALAFSELFETHCIVILRRKFEDFCRSWCIANFREEELSIDLARQLVLLYLGYYEQ